MLKFLPISTWIQTGCTFIFEWFSELSNTLSGLLLSRFLTLEGLDDKNDYYSTFDSTCYSFGPCKLMVAYKTFSKRKYSISQIEFNLIMLTNISNRESQVMGKKRTGKIQKQFPFQKANHNSTILSAHQLRMVEERGPKLIHACSLDHPC